MNKWILENIDDVKEFKEKLNDEFCMDEKDYTEEGLNGIFEYCMMSGMKLVDWIDETIENYGYKEFELNLKGQTTNQ